MAEAEIFSRALCSEIGQTGLFFFLSELKRQCRDPYIPNWIWQSQMDCFGWELPDQQISCRVSA